MVQQSFNPYAGYDFDNQIEEQEEEQVAQENNKFFNPYAGYDFDSQQNEEQPAEKQTDVFDPYAGYDFSDKPSVEEPEVYDPDEYDLDVEKSFDEFAEDKGYMDSVEEYAISRYGEDGKKLKDETNEEYLNRFLTHIRGFENNSIELASQLDWVRGATEEEKQNFGYIYSQLDKMPSFFEEGGGSFGRGLRDYAFSIASDPLMLVGFGAGKLAGTAAQRAIVQTFKTKGKKAAMEAAKRISIREGAKPIAIGTTVEVGGETIANLGLQQIEAEAGIITEEDISFLEAGIVGGLTGVLGVGGGILSQRGIAKQAEKIIEEDKAFQKSIENAGKAASDSVEATTEELAKDGYQYNPIEGYEVLRPLTEAIQETGEPASQAAKAQLDKEVANRVTKAASEIARDMIKGGDPALSEMVQDGAKASEIVRSIITREDIDSDIISGAITRAGLTAEQFANASGVTLSDSASITGAYGSLGRFVKRMRELDPELQKEYKELFRADDATTFWGKAHDYMMKLDRERRALMVTQIATTARNVATGVMRLGFHTASNIIESSVYHMGRTGNAVAGEGAETTGRRSGIQNIMRDSFGMLGRIVDQGGSKAATDLLLQYNPRLARTLDRSLQEAGPDDLSKFSLFFNKLNLAQDVMFRRAVFADAVDKRLRRISGETMDLEKFVASGKALPNDILQDSVEEALAFTFARMPKVGGKKIGDTIGRRFIDINEAIGPLPVGLGTATFPFSRFMVNAMQFQFEYSPLNAINAIYHGAKGKHMKAIKGVSDAKSEAELMKARDAMAKSIVGTAALTSAIYYRANNQDTKWYDMKSDDGRTVDARPFFPIAPYLAVADLIVKVANDDLGEPTLKMIMEGITGAQLRTGASSFVVDTFFEELGSVDGLTGIGAQRAAEIVGGYVGELTGGALTPLRVVNDVIAQFDESAAIVRDSAQAEGLTASERATSAFRNKVFKNIPVLQKSLPEYESPTREGPIIKQSPLIGQLTGVRKEARRSVIETELIDLGYENYTVMPSTGDKMADSYTKRHLGKLVETQLASEIDNDFYRNKSRTQRKAIMANKLKRFRKLAKIMGKAEASRGTDKGYTPFDRAEYAKTSKIQRKLADEYYVERYGKTVMEMQEEQPEVNHLKIAKIVGRGLARGLR
tara:strand:- start:7228 stop:10671 length:3444 start_codon:yes stop_codon:yes gene_type:complete